MKSSLLALTLMAGLLSSGIASGQPAASEARPQDKAARRYPNLFPAGLAYSGVTLKGGEPPKPKAPPPAGLNYLTWPGFRADAKVAEVFVQLTGPVAYAVRQRGNRVSIDIKKVKVYLRNNLRAVVTKHFPGPVSSFRLRRVGRQNARLEIHLARKVAPTVELKTQGAYSFLIASFPVQ